MTTRRIGVLAHPNRPQSAPVADHIAATLRARGFDTWVRTQWTDTSIADAVGGTDLIVAIGGDGAMLHAARACAAYNLPVLGVNMGYLGFLTEIRQPDEWDQHLDQIAKGSYWIEERMMIRAHVRRDGELIYQADALNDVVVSRGTITRMIRLETYIDGDWTTTYNADALIVATATGSTAYALASGGPILPPEMLNILVLPVAPHLSLDRPIILSQGATVEVVVSSDMPNADSVLSADGVMLCDLHSGDRVSVCASELIGRFARLRERGYFYRSLLDRLEPRHPPPATGLPNKD